MTGTKNCNLYGGKFRGKNSRKIPSIRKTQKSAKKRQKITFFAIYSNIRPHGGRFDPIHRQEDSIPRRMVYSHKLLPMRKDLEKRGIWESHSYFFSKQP